MIQIKNLTKVYSGKEQIKAINGVNLSINSGEIIGIIGASGAGKSTLLRCMNLLEYPTTGEIKINDVDLTKLALEDLRQVRQKIGMIFQHFSLLSSRTVAENIELPMEITAIPKKKRRARINELLDFVKLSQRQNHYPAQLSGGEKQRVGIARALANNPQVLLCDEATSALDPITTNAILDLIKKVNQELGLTVVLITHEMDVIRKICDRVAVMDNGIIHELAEVQQIFTSPKSPITKRLLDQVKLKIDPEILSGAEYSWIVKVTFIGRSAKRPIISQLIQKYQLTINILAANIEQIRQIPFGELIVEIDGEEEKIRQAIEELIKKKLRVEVIKDGTISSTIG